MEQMCIWWLHHFPRQSNCKYPCIVAMVNSSVSFLFEQCFAIFMLNTNSYINKVMAHRVWLGEQVALLWNQASRISHCLSHHYMLWRQKQRSTIAPSSQCLWSVNSFWAVFRKQGMEESGKREVWDIRGEATCRPFRQCYMKGRLCWKAWLVWEDFVFWPYLWCCLYEYLINESFSPEGGTLYLSSGYGTIPDLISLL